MSQTIFRTYYVGDLVMPANKGPALPGIPTPPNAANAADVNALQQQVQQQPVGGGLAGTTPNGVGSTSGERPQVDMTPLIAREVALSDVSAELRAFNGPTPPGVAVITDFLT